MSQHDLEKAQADASFADVVPVKVRLENVSVAFRSEPPLPLLKPWLVPTQYMHSRKHPDYVPVLDDVSARLPAGSLTAILGGSGSGKTTLLNSISHRVPSSKLKTTGSVTYNGSPDLNTVRSAYVMQQDVLLSTLTVRETLLYSADLRLPNSTVAERKAVVEKTILELGLKDAADTRIGSSSQKGASGGEKRRTSIGVQMLANPSVLFCDEPTTGLDSTSAHQVVKRLKSLADSGRTVIMSIHAPRSEIWGLFDQVILLSRGATLFSGAATSSLPHFAGLGYELPAFCNPAEHLIDLAAIDTRNEVLEAESQSRVRRLQEAWKGNRSRSWTSEQDDASITTPEKPLPHQTDFNEKQAVSLARQVSILVSRTIKVTLRDPMGLAASLFEAVSMTIITGWIFLQLGRDTAGIRSRQGALYNAASLQGYLVLLFECYRLTHDIQLFDREHREGVVSVKAFIVSRRLAKLFLEDLPVPTIFTLVYYFMVGLRLDAATFFIFYAVVVISHYIAVNLALVCVATSRDFGGASLIANLCYTLQSLACGYFIQSNQIPVYVRWLKWTAYNFYVFGALAWNEFIGVNGGQSGQFYDCPTPGADPSDPACQQYVGRFIVESLGFPPNWLWRPIIVAVAFSVFFFLLSGLILRFWKRDIGIASARKNEDLMIGREKIQSKSSGSVVPVSVDLHRYGLEVIMRRLRGRRSTRKTILNPFTACFQPGKINVIMGPSGSGKTSLLQSLAQRLESSVTSKYIPSGHITLNGAVASPDVLRSVTSFVTQDDDALMAELTVRETLRFAAGLRLPSSMSSVEKNQRAEDVMLKMGLKDCADNVIGSELKKGISGGEKRRVSIAIQILTDPKILLLDEPTSGLDAFTATSIIEVLQTLKTEGRNIILTIHQARSDIFSTFDNVVLLARGGSLVYAGPGHGMLDHFSGLGYDCPHTTNPADFVLDAITVDLQEATKEALSREKVQHLINAWQAKATSRPPLLHSQSRIATPAELNSLKRRMNPVSTTFPLVTHRSLLQISRSPDILLARTMQVIGIGAIFALFFAPLQKNYLGVQSHAGFVQEVAALYFVGMLQNLSVYPYARSLFYREHTDVCYGPFTFLLSYTLLELPFTAISSVGFGALVYAVNFKRTVGFTFIAAFNCFAIITCGESVGIIFCTLFKSHVGFSVQVMSIILSVANILGGIMSLNIPSFLQAWNYLSPIKYQVANMAAYGLRGEIFTCEDAQRVNGRCPLETGEDVLRLYNLDVDPGANLAALGACVVVYRLVAFLVLWAARKDWDWEWVFGWARGRRRRGTERNTEVEGH